MDISLGFYVDAFTRRGQEFDMESLAYVVLASWRHDLTRSSPIKVGNLYRPSSLWISMSIAGYGGQGLEIADEPPPSAPARSIVAELMISKPPTLSVAGNILPELTTSKVMNLAPYIGLDLTFRRGTDIGEFGFAGPVKPLIDCMSPILGRDRRGGPADHRIHDLRIRYGEWTEDVVRARFWYS